MKLLLLALSLFSIPLAAQSQPSALSVVLIYLDGGPAQTDMFDPKPDAGANYYGKYKTPLETNVKGTFIGEKLPLLAAMHDKYSIIRSMTHQIFGHETAHYAMVTGDLSGGEVVYPAFGGVIAFKSEATYKGVLPPNITLVGSSTRFNEAGFLGPKYKAFDTGGAPEKRFFNVEGIVNQEVSVEMIERRKLLLDDLEKVSPFPIETATESDYLDYRRQNYELIAGKAREVFDLSGESDETRARYGMSSFGQSCLTARRLVEAGVPFVTVRYTGWDTHKEHFSRMDERLKITDMGVSSLLQDLSDRGLLGQTIILCGGEFGRTPRVMNEPPWNGGRGHFGAAFSYLVAGGGFKGGMVIGSTDPKGEKVATRPVYPADLIGSVYLLMGIDPHARLPHPRLTEVPILPSLGKEGQSGGLLFELMETTPPTPSNEKKK